MEWEDLARELSQQTDSKIVLLVMDGVGGLPADGRSELRGGPQAAPRRPGASRHWIADYLKNIEKYPPLSQVNPSDILKRVPQTPPQNGESIENVLKDVDKILMDGITDWNHPGFMAYFNSTSSGPGILAEFLTAALGVNGMLWKTSPAFTEHEKAMMNWFRQMVGLPENY